MLHLNGTIRSIWLGFSLASALVFFIKALPDVFMEKSFLSKKLKKLEPF
jgi:hypothetical protein